MSEKAENLGFIILVALTVAYFLWLARECHQQPVRERAAYLEGRYGLDHATAMGYAWIDIEAKR